MQIIFEMDDRSYGTKRTFGFMIFKFVGERKCEFHLHFAVFTQWLECKFFLKNMENFIKNFIVVPDFLYVCQEYFSITEHGQLVHF